MPAKDRNNEATGQCGYLEAHGYPVTDRRGVSINKPVRPVEKYPIYQAAVEIRDFSLGKAVP